MPRAAEAIPAASDPARASRAHRAAPHPAHAFKRPAAGQVLQTFDAGDLVIEHWPDSRARAVGLGWVARAVAAALVVAVLFMLLVRRGVRTHGDWDLLLLVLGCWLGLIGVLAGLARRAWRDLVLRAGPDGLRLVTGGRERRWPAGRVGAIGVYETGRADPRWPLGELQIDVGDPAGPLRLLADHDAEQLEMLARLLRTALGTAAANPYQSGPEQSVSGAREGSEPNQFTGPQDVEPESVATEQASDANVNGSERTTARADPSAPAPAGTIAATTPPAKNPISADSASSTSPGSESAPHPSAPAAIDRLVGLHRALWQDGRLKPQGPDPADAAADGSADDPDEPLQMLDYAQQDKRLLARVLPVAGPVPVRPLDGGGAETFDPVPLATAVSAPLAALAPADAPESAHAPASILDYAGPRPRGRDDLANTRLPTVSDLRLDFEPDGGVTITETLAGKDMAIVAIAFAVIILVLVACTAVMLVTQEHPPDRGGASVLGVVFVVELVVLLLVISNTWRRTIVRAGPAGGLRLAFHALLRRPKRHHWPAGRVKKLSVLPQPGPRGLSEAASPAEIRIDIHDGPRLHLFTGHPKAELWPLSQHIERALGERGGAAKD